VTDAGTAENLSAATASVLTETARQGVLPIGNDWLGVNQKRVCRWLRETRPEVTTIVSYSDPSVGHTGALYRASNWLWAPTWHRLRTPPSGNGKWSARGKSEAVKDRWVFCLASDPQREAVLALQDESLRRRFPWAEYRDGKGGDYKRWRAVTPQQDGIALSR
jgi:hypothetical protein